MSAMPRTATRSWSAYLEILRIDHWIKNAFVVPGVVLALAIEPDHASADLWWKVPVGLFAACLVSSSNYVVNELLDAPSDLQHPLKSDRPVPRGDINRSVAWLQWVALMLVGVGVGFAISPAMAAALFVLWLCGTVYNVPPTRTKDIPYLDVISEAFNNPVRLVIGWLSVGLPLAEIPFSIVVSYWLLGCYFMAIKRYAELRHLGRLFHIETYRRVFAAYSEGRLLATIIAYGIGTGVLFAVFAVGHQVGLLLSLPFLAVVMGLYLRLAFVPNSEVQAPEKLYREPALVIAVLGCAAVTAALFIVELP
jgi:decaprenyl-phosphate phosphoribosyltransferase